MRAAVLAILVASAAVARAAPVETRSTPYPGVTLIRWTDAAANQRAYLVVLDLSAAALTLRVTDEVDRGRTTSAAAAAHGAQLAINGDLFALPGFVPAGLAVGLAGPWASSRDDQRQAVLRFGKTAAGTDALIIVPESVVAPADLPPFVTGALGGRPLVVRAGQVPASFDCADPAVVACQRGPRTAIGLSEDRRTMTIAVVDGWQAGAIGMTAAEVGALLLGRGVRDAMLLDGGSASTLFVANQGGVVNQPSDGSERAVANHLTIAVGPSPTRTLFGVVREGNIVTGPSLGGVRVTLDDGRAITTADVDASYTFTDVPIRYVCVDAVKAGYQPVHQCKQMEAGPAMTFNSIAMVRVGAGPDAGVDAGLDASVDATSADARLGDGSVDGPSAGGGSGGCATGGDRAGLAGLVGFMVLARRRARRIPR